MQKLDSRCCSGCKRDLVAELVRLRYVKYMRSQRIMEGQEAGGRSGADHC